MGQKCNPRGMRVGIIEGWESFWYANDQEYGKLLAEDLKLRKYLKEHLYKAGISRIWIGRKANQIEIDIHTAKPGLIIGKGGKEVSAIRDELGKRTGKQVQLNVQEEKNPDACSVLVAESIAVQLEKRIAHRRAMKQAIGRVQKTGVKGVKVICSGRLNGAEIARRETLSWGSLPLHTIRADVDYSRGAAQTTYGKIGVKLWIYKGEKFNK